MNLTESQSRDVLIYGAAIGVQQDNSWLVRDVDISISKGEIVTLIGPNGSGKSTIAKVVTGAKSPSVGSIKRMADLKIGYVPQNLNIDWTFPLTVSRLLTLTGNYSTDSVQSALLEMNITNLSDAPVQQLSGGEFQRVLLARAMIGKPDLLVLDEPVQGIDFAGQGALYDMIGKVRDQTGCGVLMISHDLHVVMAQTDKVICLNGHVCCSGTPEHVANSPQYAKLFGPSVRQTHAFYHHHHDHTHNLDGRVTTRETVDENEGGTPHAG